MWKLSTFKHKVCAYFVAPHAVIQGDNEDSFYLQFKG